MSHAATEDCGDEGGAEALIKAFVFEFSSSLKLRRIVYNTRFRERDAVIPSDPVPLTLSAKTGWIPKGTE